VNRIEGKIVREWGVQQQVRTPVRKKERKKEKETERERVEKAKERERGRERERERERERAREGERERERETSRPYSSCKHVEGSALLMCPLGAGTNWYKTFPSDHYGRLEMKDSTMLSNTNSTVI